jgi:hypothetical protein
MFGILMVGSSYFQVVLESNQEERKREETWPWERPSGSDLPLIYIGNTTQLQTEAYLVVEVKKRGG